MDDLTVSIPGLGVALGIGFLIGVERERSKGSGPERAPAGVRTVALAALAVLLAFAANSVTKAVVAWVTGGPAFALRVVPGVVLMLVAAAGGVLAVHV